MGAEFDLDQANEEIAKRYGVPRAVYRRMLGQESGDESGANTGALSKKGAGSAWQIMPATAKGLGINRDDPLEAAEGGLRLLRDNYKRFRPKAENEKHAWMMAVAGYHGNPDNVERDLAKGGRGLPKISDGDITTEEHVLKIFDGITSDAFDRSPTMDLKKQTFTGDPMTTAPQVEVAVGGQSKPAAHSEADVSKYRQMFGLKPEAAAPAAILPAGKIPRKDVRTGGDAKYDFQATGKTPGGLEYTHEQGGKFYAKNADGDTYELDANAKQWKPVGVSKKGFDVDGNEYALGDQTGMQSGAVRRVRDGKNFIFSPDGKIKEEGAIEVPEWATGKTKAVSQLPPDPVLQKLHQQLVSQGAADSEELRQRLIAGYTAKAAGKQKHVFTDEEIASLDALVGVQVGQQPATIQTKQLRQAGKGARTEIVTPEEQEAGQPTFYADIDPATVPEGQDVKEGVFRQTAKQLGQQLYGRDLDKVEVEALTNWQKASRKDFVFRTEGGLATDVATDPVKGRFQVSPGSVAEAKNFLDANQDKIDQVRVEALSKRIESTLPLTEEDIAQFGEMGIAPERIEAAYKDDPAFAAARSKMVENKKLVDQYVKDLVDGPAQSAPEVAHVRALHSIGAVDQAAVDRVYERERQARAAIDEQLKNPAWYKQLLDEVPNAVGEMKDFVVAPFKRASSIKSAMETKGGNAGLLLPMIYSAWEGSPQEFRTISSPEMAKRREKAVRDAMRSMELEFGSLASQQDFMAENAGEEWNVPRQIVQFGRNIVKNLAEIPKSLATADAALEEIKPLGFDVPPDYIPNLRTAGNIIRNFGTIITGGEIADQDWESADTPASGRKMFEMGKWLADAVGDDKYLRQTASGEINAALASGLTFLLGGFVAKGMKYGVPLLGASMQIGSTYEELRAAGVDEKDARKWAVVIGGAAGYSEKWGVGGTAERALARLGHELSEDSVKRLTRAILDFASATQYAVRKEFKEEFYQELGQSAFLDSAVKAIAAKNKTDGEKILEFFDDLPRSLAQSIKPGLIGGFSGGLLGGGTHAAVQGGVEAYKFQARKEDAKIDEGIAEFDAKDFSEPGGKTPRKDAEKDAGEADVLARFGKYEGGTPTVKGLARDDGTKPAIDGTKPAATETMEPVSETIPASTETTAPPKRLPRNLVGQNVTVEGKGEGRIVKVRGDNFVVDYDQQTIGDTTLFTKQSFFTPAQLSVDGISLTEYKAPKKPKVQETGQTQFSAEELAGEQPTGAATAGPSTAEVLRSIRSGRAASGKGGAIQKFTPNDEDTLRVFTPQNEEYRISPVVVDDSDILASTDEGYPEILQPRDRSSIASDVQVMEIARNLIPEKLGDSFNTNDGRPIAVPVTVNGKQKYALVTGNGRQLSIRAARVQFPESYRKYEEFARSKDPSAQAKNPVYIALLDNSQLEDGDLRTIAVESNKSQQSAMSPVEQAKVDAESLDESIMKHFAITDSGEVDIAANRGFISKFFERNVSKNERGSLIDKEGTLTVDGANRIKRAILARAYGETEVGLDVMQKIVETPIAAVQNVVTALTRTAPAFADLKAASAAGKAFPEMDITEEIAIAFNQFADLKKEGKDVDAFLRQVDLPGAPGLNGIEKRLVEIFQHYTKAAKQLSDVLRNYTDGVNGVGDPNQINIFGEKPVLPDPNDLLKAAVETFEEENGVKDERRLRFTEFEQGERRAGSRRSVEKGDQAGQTQAGSETGEAAQTEAPAREEIAGETAAEPESVAAVSGEEVNQEQATDKTADETEPEKPAVQDQAVAPETIKTDDDGSTDISHLDTREKFEAWMALGREIDGVNQRDAQRPYTPAELENIRKYQDYTPPSEFTAALSAEEKADLERRDKEFRRLPAIGKPAKKVGDKKFSSTQVNLADEDAKRFSRFARGFIDPKDIADDKPDFAEDGFGGEPHITVKYGIHSNDASSVKDLIAGENPVSVKLGRTKIFEGNKNKKPYDVVVVDVESPDLHRLNKKIADGTEVTDTFPEYKPHMTVAYVKAGSGEEYAGNSAFEGQEFTFDTIDFSPAEGDHVAIPLTGAKTEQSASIEGGKYATQPAPEAGGTLFDMGGLDQEGLFAQGGPKAIETAEKPADEKRDKIAQLESEDELRNVDRNIAAFGYENGVRLNLLAGQEKKEFPATVAASNSIISRRGAVEKIGDKARQLSRDAIAAINEIYNAELQDVPFEQHSRQDGLFGGAFLQDSLQRAMYDQIAEDPAAFDRLFEKALNSLQNETTAPVEPSPVEKAITLQTAIDAFGLPVKPIDDKRTILNAGDFFISEGRLMYFDSVSPEGEVSYSVEFDPDLKGTQELVLMRDDFTEETGYRVAQPEASEVEATTDPAVETDEITTVDGAEPAESAAIAASITEPITDFGEKIGGARKDRAESGFTMRGGKKKESDEPAWMKGFEIGETSEGKFRPFLTETGTRRGARLIAWESKEEFDTAEEALRAIKFFAVMRKFSIRETQGKTEIYRKVGTRKIHTIKSFDSRDEAMRYIVEKTDELLEYKPHFPERPHIEDLQRTGEDFRNGTNMSTKKFLDEFGFTGGEFGNWVPQDERQRILNMAYDGLRDLANILGVPPRALSLNGQLSIAFGSRGRGLTGAAAHYERERAVFNLTRLNGAGSVAHEWFHALDNYFGAQNQGKTLEKDEKGEVKAFSKRDSDFLSHAGNYVGKSMGKARQEIRDGFKDLIQTIYKQTAIVEVSLERYEKEIDRHTKNVENGIATLRSYLERADRYTRKKKPASEEQLRKFDDLAGRIKAGELGAETEIVTKSKWERSIKTHDVFKDLNDLITEVTGRGEYRSRNERSDGGSVRKLEGFVSSLAAATKQLAHYSENNQEERLTPTRFAYDAKDIDRMRVSSYWSTEHEMAARAFEAYIEDQLKERGDLSQYLVHSTENSIYKLLYDLNPYPEGVERERINKAFGKFFETVETRTEDGGDVSMFSIADSQADSERSEDTILSIFMEGGQTDTTAFKKWFGESKVVDEKGEPLRVYHGTDSDFDEHEGYEIAGWFSEGPELANDRYTDRGNGGDLMGPNIRPVFLSIQNPLDLYDVFDMDDELYTGRQILQDAGLPTEGVSESTLNYHGPAYDTVNQAWFAELAKKQGYDGIRITENGTPTWAIFQPSQAKSAIGNRGTFDPDEDSIMLSIAEPVEASNVFYSAVGRAIVASKQNKFSIDQVKALLQSPGLKQEEVDDLHFDLLLQMKDAFGEKSITKDELLETVAANQILVEPVVKAGDQADQEFERLIDQGWSREAAEAMAAEQEKSGVVQFATFQLPGGENYKEIFLTAPPSKHFSLKAWQDGHSEYADVKNPIVRLRWNERTDAAGRRVLFLEEIQGPNEENVAKMPKVLQKFHKQMGLKYAVRYAAENGFDAVGWTTGDQQADRYSLAREVEKIEISTNMSGQKQVRIEPIGASEHFVLEFIVDADGKVFNATEEDFEGKDLAELVPKELGRKILDMDAGTIEGEGLKVGGEGLKSLYDKVLPSFAKKLYGKFGAKVETGGISGQESQEYVGKLPSLTRLEQLRSGVGSYMARQIEEIRQVAWRGGDMRDAISYHGSTGLANLFGGKMVQRPTTTTVHTLPITDALRESVLGGQPMFSIEEETRKVAVRLLKNVPIDELVTASNFDRQGDRIKLDLPAMELLRRAFEQVDIEEGKREFGKEETYPSFLGLFTDPARLRKAIAVLEKASEDAKTQGESENAKILEQFTSELENAKFAGKGTAIFYVVDQKLPQEIFHQGVYLGSVEKSLTRRHARPEKLDASPAFKKADAAFFSLQPEYSIERIAKTRKVSVKQAEALRNAMVREEIAGWVAEGSWEEIGLTEDEGYGYLLDFFESFADKVYADHKAEGKTNEEAQAAVTQALQHFEEIDHAQEAIRQIAQSVRGNVSSRPSGKADAGRSETEDTPGAPGSPEGGTQADPKPDPLAGFEPVKRQNLPGDAGLLGARGEKKLAQLPSTQRAAGIAADDVIYTVFGDKPAQRAAGKMIEENGIDGTIVILKNTESPDVHHAIAGFVIQRILRDEAARIEQTDPEEARKITNIALDLGAMLAMRMVRAGRFVRAASVIAKTTTGLLAAAQKIYQDKHGLGNHLPADIIRRLENKGSVSESALAEYESLKKQLDQLTREMNALKQAMAGNDSFRRASKGAIANRKKLVTQVKKKHQAEVDAAVARLRSKALIKSKLSPITSFESDMADVSMMSIYDEDGLTPEELEDFGTVGAMLLMEGLAAPTMIRPVGFDEEMVGLYGEVITPHLEDIHREALRKRNTWVAEVAKEKEIAGIVKQFGENLTDDEIEAIVQERHDELKRRDMIMRLHTLRAERGQKTEAISAIESVIARIENDETVVAAAVELVHRKPSAHEFYRRMEELGIKGFLEKDAREALRKGSEVLEKARLIYAKEKAAAEDELRERIQQGQTDLKELAGLTSQARTRARESQKEIEKELKRIGAGELGYYAEIGRELINTPRAIMASTDLSFLLRQGGWLMLAKLFRGKGMHGASFSALVNAATTRFNKLGYERTMEEMEKNPYFELAVRAGMDFAGLGKHGEFSITKGEEEFRSNILKMLAKPTEGKAGRFANPAFYGNAIIQKSDELYTAFLDAQRLATFAATAEYFDKQLGLSYETHPKEFRALAEYVNDATGRSWVGGSKAANLLMNLPLFAPRFTVSRFKLLWKSTAGLAFLPPATRRVVLRDAAQFYAITGSLLTLAWMAGASAGLDWDDDDFLKIRLGDNHYDLFVGMQQPLRAMARATQSLLRKVLGERYSGGLVRDSVYYVDDNGKVQVNEFGEEMGLNLNKSIWVKFLRSKLGPQASLATDWVADEDFLGNKFSWGNAVLSRITPLGARDAVAAAIDGGPTGLISALPATMFGVGYSRYEKNQDVRTPAEKFAAKINSIRFADKVLSEEAKGLRDALFDIRDRVRAGEDMSEQITAMYENGDLTKAEADRMLRGGEVAPLLLSLQKMPIPLIREVRKIAQPGEREMIDTMLSAKQTKKDETARRTKAREDLFGKPKLGAVEAKDKKPLADRLNRADVRDALILFQEYSPQLDAKQTADMRRALKAKVLNSYQKGTLSRENYDAAKKVFGDGLKIVYREPRKKPAVSRPVTKSLGNVY